MLDKYVNAIINRLSNVIATVSARRDELERQRSTDRFAQSYLGTALKHPEGHTVPLRKSAERAQHEYAEVRAEWAQKGPEALALLASLVIARERRDETKAVWERHDAAEQERVHTKYHPEVRRLFSQLFDHGITPAMVEQLWPETIGIIADIILWQVSDREGQDADSPIPGLFEMYAERTMIMPGGSHTVVRSTPGVPPAKVKYTDPPHYMFGVRAPTIGTAPPLVEDDGGMVIGDVIVATVGPAQDHTSDAVAPPAAVPEATTSTKPAPAAPAANAVPVAPTLDEATAAAWAEQMSADDPHVGIYWPDGYPVGDFDQERLVRALGEYAKTDRAWSGSSNFLAAAEAGGAEQFIADRRLSSIKSLANRLIAGEHNEMERARRAGLWGT